MIYVVSSGNAAAIKRSLGTGKKFDWIEIMQVIPDKRKLKSGDQVYFDVGSLSQAELKKALGPLKKNGVFWGVIDPKGSAADPASFFFQGACDYIAPALVKKGLDKKRFAAAFSWVLEGKTAGDGKFECQKEEKTGSSAGSSKSRKGQVLPPGDFGGWKSIRSGSTGFFFFLIVSLPEKSDLRSVLGEGAFKTVKNRLRDVLQLNLREADALLWMETEGNSLFLIPPKAENCKDAVEASLKILLNSRLIGIEKLGLSLPLELSIALHYGQTIFQAPGKTGGVVSEPVNYIFHLGTKKAETGRLTMSDDVPIDLIPAGLSDFFVSAGEFEGLPIRHSRRFCPSTK